MSNDHLVISAIGEDRVGIIRELAQATSEAGCHIADSRMTVLGGDFAIIMLADGRWHELAKLESALPNLERRLGLTITTRRTSPGSDKQTRLLPYSVEVVGMDEPGIVQQLTDFIAEREINVREMATTRSNAAYTGTPLFCIQLTLDIPAETSIARLREEFMEFCDGLNLDANLEPLKS